MTIFVSTIYLDKNDFNSFERRNLINSASSWEVYTDSRKTGQICPMPQMLPAGMDASFDKYLLKNNSVQRTVCAKLLSFLNSLCLT